MLIRQLAKVIGIMVASVPDAQYEKLLYRRCDILKAKTLKSHGENYAAKLTLTRECQQDIWWWIENVDIANRNVILPDPVLVLETDALDKREWRACKLPVKGSTGGPGVRQRPMNT